MSNTILILKARKSRFKREQLNLGELLKILPSFFGGAVFVEIMVGKFGTVECVNNMKTYNIGGQGSAAEIFTDLNDWMGI